MYVLGHVLSLSPLFTNLSVARQFIELTPEFKKELNLSLAKETDEEKQSALMNLFESYGHVFPLEVVLGGTFIQSAQGQVESDEYIEVAKSDLRLSLDAHVVGAGVGGGKSQERAGTSKNVGFQRSIHVHGGDSTIQDPKKWIDSVKYGKHILKVHIKPDRRLTYASYLDRNWRVVRIQKVIPIVDFLTEAERKEITRVKPPRFKALSGKWVYLKTQPLPGMFYIYYSIPRF